MNFADNGFKDNSSGGGAPIVPRQHGGPSSGYVSNGYMPNDLHTPGIKTVPVVERDKTKKEVYAGNGFDSNVNHSGTVGGNIIPNSNTMGSGYIGNGFGEKKF